jgi:DNA-binding transcriptional LysR family regulator
MDWLAATKSFCLLAEHGSFTKAAHLTDISPSAMSKRIDWLEKQLGLSLFIRTTRQVTLTEQGADFLAKAKNIVSQFDNMITEAQQGAYQPSGMLKIAATLPVGSSILMPHIESFLRLFPGIKIQLDVLPIGEGPKLDHDLVICRKYDDFDSATHKGVKLISYDIGLFGAPSYLAKHSEITCLADASTHNMVLGSHFKKSGYIEMANGESCSLKNCNFVSDHLDALLYAAVNAIGLLFISPLYIKKELTQGKLVRVLPELKSAECQLWAFYPSMAFMPNKSRLFLDFVKERL